MKKLNSSLHRLKSTWILLAGAGVSAAPPDIREKVRRSNVLALGMFAAGLAYVILYGILGLYQMLPQTVFGTLINLLVPLLNHLGYTKTARGYQCFNFTIAVAAAAFMLGPETGTTMLFAPALVVVFLNFDSRERQTMFFVLALCTALVLWTDFAVEKTPGAFRFSAELLSAIRIVSRIATLVLLFMELYVFVRSIEYSQKELKEAHATTNSILNSMKECFYFVDRDWKIVYVNTETIAHLIRAGVDTRNLVGANYFDSAEIIRSQAYASELQSAMKTGQSFSAEFYVERVERWYEVRAEPSETGMSIAYRDITERKRAEAALRENEVLQNEIFNQAGTGLNLSKEGRYIRVNKEMCRILGYTEEEFLGMTFRDVSLPEYLENDDLIFDQIKCGVRDRFSVQKAYRHKSGRAVPVHVQGGVIRDSSGKPQVMVISVQDLTEARLSEQKLMHASKMSSVGEMAGSIAHEINSPMAAIRLTAEQLEDKSVAATFTPHELSVLGSTITQTVDRIAKIIRGLKAFSKNAQFDEKVEVDLAEIVNDMLELTKERFKQRNIDLSVGLLHNVKIQCRPSEISQTLVNVLNNAFEAIDDSNSQVRWVRVDLEHSGSKARLRVTDSGPGISASVLARMNEPFFTTKTKKKASGVGLKIASDVMEAHGGRIYLDQNSKLTCFTMEFGTVANSQPSQAV